jgi:hypothetical protein
MKNKFCFLAALSGDETLCVILKTAVGWEVWREDVAVDAPFSLLAFRLPSALFLLTAQPKVAKNRNFPRIALRPNNAVLTICFHEAFSCIVF